MFTKTIPTTQPAKSNRRRSVWPPQSLKEPMDAAVVTPQRWQQPRVWYVMA